MVIPYVKSFVKVSKYEESAECIQRFLDLSKIVTIRELENCPRYAAPAVCGHSTYELITFIRECTINPPEPEPEPVKKTAYKKPASKKAKAQAQPEKVTSEPVLEVQADIDEDAQSLVENKENSNG